MGDPRIDTRLLVAGTPQVGGVELSCVRQPLAGQPMTDNTGSAPSSRGYRCHDRNDRWKQAIQH